MQNSKQDFSGSMGESVVNFDYQDRFIGLESLHNTNAETIRDIFLHCHLQLHAIYYCMLKVFVILAKVSH